MNALTQENKQAMLQEHYNRANQAFQDGNYTLAMNELQQALQYAQNDKQTAHIQQTMKTVQEMMQQQAPAAPAPAVQSTPAAPAEENEAPVSTSSGQQPNKLLLLTILVGLICLTPIAMKIIEAVSQPAVQSSASPAPASPEASMQASNPEANSSVPVNPASTPDVIVEDNATQQATVTGSGINLRETASTKANSMAKLTAGESVKVLEANAQQADGYVWSKIETSTGTTGWVATQFLQMAQAANAVAPAPVDTTSTTPAASVTTDTTSAPASAVAPESTMPASTVPAATGPVKNVTGNSVSLRSQPGTKSVLVKVLSRSQITVLEDKAAQADGYTWTKIKTADGFEGWVADQFLGQ